MTHTGYNLTKKEFYSLLEQLKAREIKDTELEINTEYFYEEVKYKIGDEETVLLCDTLKKNPHIRKVTLHNQDIADIGAKALAAIDTIEELILPYNKIGPVGATALAKSNLKILCLSVNPLTEYREDTNNEDEIGDLKYRDEEEIAQMIKAFTDNKSIVDLDLSTTYISGKFIAQLINNNSTIIKLNLDSNYSSDEALHYIGNNKIIQKLFISENEITDTGAKYLAENTSLKTLISKNNKITDAGARILSTISSLKHLDLVNNNITIKGMRYFLNSKLDIVELDFNEEATKQEINVFYREFSKMLRAREGNVPLEENETHDSELVGNISESENT